MNVGGVVECGVRKGFEVAVAGQTVEHAGRSKFHFFKACLGFVEIIILLEGTQQNFFLSLNSLSSVLLGFPYTVVGPLVWCLFQHFGAVDELHVGMGNVLVLNTS